MQPYSKQRPFVNGIDELRKLAPEIADGFHDFRGIVNRHGPLEAMQRELCMLAAFTVARNERGFRIHCNLAAEAGATLAHVQQVVLLMIGSNMGLMPVLDTLRWAQEEFDGMAG